MEGNKRRLLTTKNSIRSGGFNSAQVVELFVTGGDGILCSFVLKIKLEAHARFKMVNYQCKLFRKHNIRASNVSP